MLAYIVNVVSFFIDNFIKDMHPPFELKLSIADTFLRIEVALLREEHNSPLRILHIVNSDVKPDSRKSCVRSSSLSNPVLCLVLERLYRHSLIAEKGYVFVCSLP